MKYDIKLTEQLYSEAQENKTIIIKHEDKSYITQQYFYNEQDTLLSIFYSVATIQL